MLLHFSLLEKGACPAYSFTGGREHWKSGHRVLHKLHLNLFPLLVLSHTLPFVTKDLNSESNYMQSPMSPVKESQHIQNYLMYMSLQLLSFHFPRSETESQSVMPCNTVHGILQARILEWVVFPFCKGSSQPRDQTQGSNSGLPHCRWILYQLTHKLVHSLFNLDMYH